VLPAARARLLAGHDVVLLGERGQGKTRLIRTLVGLLDEWTPVVAGCEINDHPYAPVCGRCLQLAAELGDERRSAGSTARAVRREARHPGHERRRPDRRRRPDQGGRGTHARRPADRALRPRPAHQPRHLRVNELPDLAERIQVSLLNVLEERDIQVRGYALRLPLDLCSSRAPTPRTTPTAAGSSPR
jgi:magnesium chelatase subunit I